MHTIQDWARQGLYNIPIEIGKIKELPLCLACAYSAAKRCIHNKQTKSLGSQAKEPGDFVSVDTMEAGTPGIIPYSTGHPTKRCYQNSTVWVDKISKYIHINWSSLAKWFCGISHRPSHNQSQINVTTCHEQVAQCDHL